MEEIVDLSSDRLLMNECRQRLKTCGCKAVPLRTECVDRIHLLEDTVHVYTVTSNTVFWDVTSWA